MLARLPSEAYISDALCQDQNLREHVLFISVSPSHVQTWGREKNSVSW